MADATVTHQQRAYDYIKNQIVTLGYKPGQFITDTQIANELSMSRTPVREAFYRLENEGLLVNEARRGWKVYTLSLEDINEIFDIKGAIEGMMAAQAATCNNETLRQQLRETLNIMRVAAADRDSDAWLKSDFALHDILFAMANNDRAARIVVNLNDQWHRVRIGYVAMQARIVESTQEHEEFVGAILAGDESRSEQLMRNHLNGVRNELVNLLVNLVLPFVQDGV